MYCLIHPEGPTVSLIGQGNWSACSLLIQSFIFRVKKMPKELEKGFAVAYRLEMNCFVCLCYLLTNDKVNKSTKERSYRPNFSRPTNNNEINSCYL